VQDWLKEGRHSASSYCRQSSKGKARKMEGEGERVSCCLRPTSSGDGVFIGMNKYATSKGIREKGETGSHGDDGAAMFESKSLR
jgi:hypothetical protein